MWKFLRKLGAAAFGFVLYPIAKMVETAMFVVNLAVFLLSALLSPLKLISFLADLGNVLMNITGILLSSIGSILISPLKGAVIGWDTGFAGLVTSIENNFNAAAGVFLANDNTKNNYTNTIDIQPTIKGSHSTIVPALGEPVENSVPENNVAKVVVTPEQPQEDKALNSKPPLSREISPMQ